MLFLQFELNGQRFGLETAAIVEVLPLVHWTKIPGAPSSVLGVFSYHGALVPVLDLGALALDVPTIPRADTRLALVEYPTNGETRLLAILLENATSLQRLDAKQFADAPVRSDARYAGSVAATASGLLQRIELASLVPDDLWECVTDGEAA